MLTAQETVNLIPQRPPFVMIDQLVNSGDLGSQTELLVRADNIFVVNGELTEPGLVENIAQTAAARAGYLANQQNEAVQVGYIGAIKNLEIFSLPKLGDTLQTTVTIKNQVFNVTVVEGTITCDGVQIANCEMKIFLVPNQS